MILHFQEFYIGIKKEKNYETSKSISRKDEIEDPICTRYNWSGMSYFFLIVSLSLSLFFFFFFFYNFSFNPFLIEKMLFRTTHEHNLINVNLCLNTTV